MSRIQMGMMAALVAVVASCATSPYDGQTFGDGKIPFAGFVDEPGVQIRFYVRDRTNGSYPLIDGATSSTTPTFAAGAFCANSPALYKYDKTIWPLWPVLWQQVPGGYETKVRARKFGATSEQQIMFTANPEGVNCILRNITPGCDFANVAFNICGFNRTEATVKTTSSRPWL